MNVLSTIDAIEDAINRDGKDYALAILGALDAAKDAIEHVDALVSTAMRSILSGDACDADVIIVLNEYAWPKIEATRQAIESAIQLASGTRELQEAGHE